MPCDLESLARHCDTPRLKITSLKHSQNLQLAPLDGDLQLAEALLYDYEETSDRMQLATSITYGRSGHSNKFKACSGPFRLSILVLRFQRPSISPPSGFCLLTSDL